MVHLKFILKIRCGPQALYNNRAVKLLCIFGKQTGGSIDSDVRKTLDDFFDHLDTLTYRKHGLGLIRVEHNANDDVIEYLRRAADYIKVSERYRVKAAGAYSKTHLSVSLL